jgi:hypothetical protein
MIMNSTSTRISLGSELMIKIHGESSKDWNFKRLNSVILHEKELVNKNLSPTSFVNLLTNATNVTSFEEILKY